MTNTDIDFDAPAAGIGDAVVVCDAKGRVIAWNPFAGDRTAAREPRSRHADFTALTAAGSGTS